MANPYQHMAFMIESSKAGGARAVIISYLYVVRSALSRVRFKHGAIVDFHQVHSVSSRLPLPAFSVMSQQSAEDVIGQSGNSEDHPWVYSPNTRRVVHQRCASCDRHTDHYHATGMRVSNISFQSARLSEEDTICGPLRSTLRELQTLSTSWEATDRALKQEIEQNERELEAIERETDKSSQEFDRVSRELQEVREETARFRRERARPVDDETRTPHAQPVHINLVDSDIEEISPPS